MSRRKIKLAKKQSIEELFSTPELYEEDFDGFEASTSAWDEQGYSVTSRRLNLEEHGSMVQYMEAHRSLPFDYVYRSTPTQFIRVCKEAEVLTNPDASTDALKNAIMLLAHSPCGISFVALEDFANSDHPLAILADFGLDECHQFDALPLPGGFAV